MALPPVLTGYTIEKCLRSGELSEVFEAVRADGRAVVLKWYHADRDRPLDQSDAQREFRALRAAAGPGIAEALDLVLGHGAPILVTDYVSGLSVRKWLADERTIEPAALVEIALQVVAALERVHRARWVHRDVNPNNVLVQRSTLHTCLIDFGIAQPLGSATRKEALETQLPISGTLLYMAPEQMGYNDRGCDSRSDLYSLGVTLYHALTGVPPFVAERRTEMIHAHVAQQAIPPDELQPGIPRVLASLVLKLLRKEPEERYQSTQALHADLLRIRANLASPERRSEVFELGSTEIPERPSFPRKLYGREPELVLLEQAYTGAVEGELRALMLRGEPGIGKSALVDALRPLVVKSRGLFAVGKFDLYGGKPYAGWIDALESLAQQLLLRSDDELQRWRAELRESLGNIAQSLVALVPELGYVLGDDLPGVPPLGPRETQARLALALSRFLAVCATPEHPLVLFLDDWQWSDGESRFLLEEVLCSGGKLALLLLGSYRGSEVDAEHPLRALLDGLAERRIRLDVRDVPPLATDATVTLLCDALHCPLESARRLAELVELKTGNNPLLMQEFVLHMHARGAVRYAHGSGWTWDEAQIASADIPDGAVALMVDKLERLDGPVRTLIEFASCVGSEFDVELLAQLSGQPRESLQPPLFALADQGLIAPSVSGFRFVHDRVREAAQSLISSAERQRMHYETARILLSRIPEAEQPHRIPEILEHLNRGLCHLQPEQRMLAMELNLQVGKSSLAAGASERALEYLNIAYALFVESDWESRPALGFELHLHAAEAAFHKLETQRALALLDAAIARPTSRFQLAQLAAKRAQILTLTREPGEVVAYLLEVLKRFGIDLPRHPSRLRASLQIRRVRWLLRGRKVETMLRPEPQPLDRERLAPLVLIGSAGGLTARFDIRLTVLVNCWSMLHQIRHGYPARPAYSLASHAYYSYALLTDAAWSRHMAAAAEHYHALVPDPVYGPRTEVTMHAVLNPWLMPRRLALGPMEGVAERLREVGDREWYYYARFLEAIALALSGEPLRVAHQRLAQLVETVTRAGHKYAEPAACERIYRILLEPHAPDDLEQRVRESDEQLARRSDAPEGYIRTMWVVVLCMFGRYDLAFDQSEKLGKKLFRVASFIQVGDHVFFRGMAAAVLASTASGRARRRYRAALRGSVRSLARWAVGGPDFAHMESLLRAEQARLRGNYRLARSLYESAAQRAAQQGFTHQAALAHERCGQMLAGIRRSTEAAVALGRAVSLYRQWGLDAKSELLDRDRKGLLH